MSNRYTGSNRQIWCHRFGVTHFYIIWILIPIHEVTGELTGTCPASSLTATTPDRVPGPRPHLIQTSEEGCFGNPQNWHRSTAAPTFRGSDPPPGIWATTGLLFRMTASMQMEARPSSTQTGTRLTGRRGAGLLSLSLSPAPFQLLPPKPEHSFPWINKLISGSN